MVRLVVPTSRIRAPVAASRSGSRNRSPISISSPRLTMISRPVASAVAASTSAAALLLTRCTAPAAGTARASASSAPAPRRPRFPEARSNSTSVQPAAARTASRAAADSGARPRLVCTITPVALITGVSEAAVGGSAATAASATLAGLMAPALASFCACETAALTSVPPSCSRAAASRGSASTTSVLGTRRRGSTTATLMGTAPSAIPGAAGLLRAWHYIGHMTGPDSFRLTQYARGGGCAWKIPPGELEEAVAALMPDGPGADLMVGVEHGDDGAVVRVGQALAIVATADFFTPVVDDAYTFGRIAATNALSDIYAMGGRPLV